VGYNRIELLLDRLLNFVSVCIHPPRVSGVELDQVDQNSLVFVEPTFVLSTGRCGTK
jgi:hypothetical protein